MAPVPPASGDRRWGSARRCCLFIDWFVRGRMLAGRGTGALSSPQRPPSRALSSNAHRPRGSSPRACPGWGRSPCSAPPAPRSRSPAWACVDDRPISRWVRLWCTQEPAISPLPSLPPHLFPQHGAAHVGGAAHQPQVAQAVTVIANGVSCMRTHIESVAGLVSIELPFTLACRPRGRRPRRAWRSAS